jgi:hypothetical protein
MAEYEALMHGLRITKDLGIWQIQCFGNSDLAAQQVSGMCDAKNRQMLAYKAAVDEFAKFFKGYEVKHIPRTDNHEADVLSRIGSDQKPIQEAIFHENLWVPSIQGADQDNPDKFDSPLHPLMAVILSWTQPYIDYMVDKKLPDDEVLKRQIVRRAKAYTGISGQLYNRSVTGVF